MLCLIRNMWWGHLFLSTKTNVTLLFFTFHTLSYIPSFIRPMKWRLWNTLCTFALLPVFPFIWEQLAGIFWFFARSLSVIQLKKWRSPSFWKNLYWDFCAKKAEDGSKMVFQVLLKVDFWNISDFLHKSSISIKA